ncbi:LCP family protein [Lactobacillus sp. UCMA15818]|uniref:LCP family glycopolymer transferase n=1 Tax=Lactobacillus sp. UCMA15818 TaxID=2583394 RepID=UPI0025AFA0C9|nr:LCP family protein [Lactobacillus sp. UCMA15818]MDN2452674.1 LytR family transcriptional regulator [Lactobacillus sp. UCMA15818]
MNNNNKNEFSTSSPLRRREDNHDHRRRNPHKKRRVLSLIGLIVVLILFYGAGVYARSLIGAAQQTLDKTYQKTKVKKLRNVSQILKKKKPFSILLLGTDTGDLGRTDKGRTDTIIVATINPKTKKATLTSIPRDTQVKITGSSSSYDKINSAYTIGGTSAAISTVQNTLHIPIDFYLLVNMGGLSKLVNAVGGVSIDPLLTFHYSYANVTKGKTVTLNGNEALAYSRMRYTDPEGDYGRQKRQKQVIEAIVSKLLTISSISNFQKILNTVKDNMQTDLTFNDMMTIETNYKDAAGTIKSYVLQGEDATIGGLSYQVATAAEKQKISNKIRSELGLNPSNATFVGQISSYGSNSTYGSSSSSSYGAYSSSSRSTYGTYSSSSPSHYGY